MTRVFSISLLGFIILTSLIVPVSAETDFSSDLRYAWFGSPSAATDDYTSFISNTLQPVYQGLSKNFYLALSFPIDDILYPYEYYTFSFVFSGSAVTDLAEDRTFLTNEVSYLGNPFYIRDRTTRYNLHLDPFYSGSEPYKSYPLDGFDVYNEFSNNSQIFKFTILAERLYWYQNSTNEFDYVGLLFKLNEEYIRNHSDVVVLVSIRGHYELAEATSDLELLKQIGVYTGQIIGSIDENSDYLGHEINNVRLDVVDSVNNITDLISEDAGFENNIDSSVNDFTGQNSRLTGLSTSILQSGVTINGVTYVISNPSSNLFEGVLAAYGSDLSNFNLTAPVSASIFRHVIDSWVSVFGILIFMSLIIGVLGALLGRSTG